MRVTVFISSFPGSSSSGRGGGGGGGARLGHWPISAFSKETGWEKSDNLREQQAIRFNDGYKLGRAEDTALCKVSRRL